MTVENTLAERGKRYGDFSDHAEVCQQLQNVMRSSRTSSQKHGWDRLSDVQKQALTVIADKIARILTGDPDYDDNWHDIQGYAKLVEDRLPKAEASPPPVENGYVSVSAPCCKYPNLTSKTGSNLMYCLSCGSYS